MTVDRQGDVVRVWRGERYPYDDEDMEDVEAAPDFVLSADEANALVVELLRGPTGPPGPIGPMGLAR